MTPELMLLVAPELALIILGQELNDYSLTHLDIVLRSVPPYQMDPKGK